MTKVSPPTPTTINWIDTRRPTAADAMPDGEVQYLIDGKIIGLSKWYIIASNSAMVPWAHCPGWSEPEKLVPDDHLLDVWTREFTAGNAAGRKDCASIVTFIATRTAEWIANQRKRGQ